MDTFPFFPSYWPVSLLDSTFSQRCLLSRLGEPLRLWPYSVDSTGLNPTIPVRKDHDQLVINLRPMGPFPCTTICPKNEFGSGRVYTWQENHEVTVVGIVDTCQEMSSFRHSLINSITLITSLSIYKSLSPFEVISSIRWGRGTVGEVSNVTPKSKEKYRIFFSDGEISTG